MDFSIQAACGATLLVAAVTDILYSRVPNWLTLPACIVALGMHSLSKGAEGAIFSAAGLLAGFALLIGFYAVGGMGAGDVKLLATVGAFVGAEAVLDVFLLSALFGGLYAVGILAYVHRRRAADERRDSLVELLKSIVLASGNARFVQDTLRGYPKLRYAVAIAAGFVGAESQQLLS